MTDATWTYGSNHASAALRTAPATWPVFAIAFAGILLVSLPNLLDPMIRHDDYPAYFADAERFWSKTLHEGRWINYLWHLREIVTPSWFNFILYQGAWATFAASLGIAAMGRDGPRWYAAVLALMVLIAAPATMISLWFNTLIPGLWLVALYGLAVVFLPTGVHRALLLPFVVVTFMSYTTYPLLLLALCLAGSRRRSLRDLMGLLALFAVSFLVALLVTYSLNWHFHGVFGVPPADWREGVGLADLPGPLANLPTFFWSLGAFARTASYNYEPAAYYHFALFLFASGALVRLAPREALYLHAGLWTGMALMLVQVLKLGVIAPPRAFLFAWVFYAIIALRAAVLLAEKHPNLARLARNLILLIVLSYALRTGYQYSLYRTWQAETRTIAEMVSEESTPVLLDGTAMSMGSAKKAFVQFETALPERLRQLTGRSLLYCSQAPDLCAAIAGGAPGRMIHLPNN